MKLGRGSPGTSIIPPLTVPQPLASPPTTYPSPCSKPRRRGSPHQDYALYPWVDPTSPPSESFHIYEEVRGNLAVTFDRINATDLMAGPEDKNKYN